jgi:hypothetical protein
VERGAAAAFLGRPEAQLLEPILLSLRPELGNLVHVALELAADSRPHARQPTSRLPPAW